MPVQQLVHSQPSSSAIYFTITLYVALFSVVLVNTEAAAEDAKLIHAFLTLPCIHSHSVQAINTEMCDIDVGYHLPQLLMH